MPDPNKISLTADELKALELIISVAQSQGVNPAENLAFITVVVPALVRVVPVLVRVTPAVVGGAAAAQQVQQSGLGGSSNATLNDLIELRRRANLS